MKVIPVRLPDKIIEIIDKLVQEGFYANRSAAIRVIVTRYVLEETEKIEKE
jgi:Arc/MetJ-type ribon-helix-helix transcriptional regulator